MIEGLKPYPSYKDSGVPWLGKLPEHWGQHALWTLSKLRVERNPGNLSLLSVFLGRGVIRYEDGGGQVHAPSMDLSHYQVVQPGDFVLNNQQAWRGSVGVSRHRGIISPAYIVLSLSGQLDASFSDCLMQSPTMVGQFVLASKGVGDIQRQIYWPYLRLVQVPLPPLPEQSSIVRFLEHANRRIERYIRAKKKLIALLNEQKQVIIHHAVTRGLNPNVRLKSSEIEWMGDVPEHWKVLPLKRWVSTKITDGPHDTPVLLDDGIDFMSAESMVNGRFDFSRRRGFISRQMHEIYCRKCRPQRDDIFMCKSGATTGKVAIVETDDQFSVWSPLALIRSDKRRVLPRLLYMALQARYVQRQVQDTWSYGTQPNLSMAAMERLRVVLPPLNEQHKMLANLDSALGIVEAAIDRAQSEISLLHEYRTRLIADVVTGKLDVRAVAAKLPDEPEMLESVDTQAGEETIGDDNLDDEIVEADA